MQARSNHQIYRTSGYNDTGSPQLGRYSEGLLYYLFKLMCSSELSTWYFSLFVVVNSWLVSVCPRKLCVVRNRQTTMMVVFTSAWWRCIGGWPSPFLPVVGYQTDQLAAANWRCWSPHSFGPGWWWWTWGTPHRGGRPSVRPPTQPAVPLLLHAYPSSSNMWTTPDNSSR